MIPFTFSPSDFAHLPEPLIAISLALFTFILEDAATVLAALLSVEGKIHPLVALVSIFIGIFTGDILVYFFGRACAKYKRLKRWFDKRFSLKARSWLEERLFYILFSVAFLPGMRFPTYSSAGYFGFDFKTYLSAVLLASFIRSLVLFSVVFFLGEQILNQLGPWKWPAFIVLFTLIVFGVPKIIGKFSKK